MDSESIIEQVRSLLPMNRLDAAEIYLERQRHLLAESKNESLHGLERSLSIGIAIRLEKEARIGFAYSNDLRQQALERIISLAYNSLHSAEPRHPQKLPGPDAATALPEFDEYDEALASRTTKEKVDKAISLEREARHYDRRITQVRGALYKEVDEERCLWNSRLGHRTGRRTHCEVQLMAVASDASGQQSAWSQDFSPYFDSLGPEAAAHEAASQAIALLSAKPVKTGRYTAVLDRAVVAACLGILAPSFLAESVQKKKSPLAGKLGQRLYADCIDVMDDGLYVGGAASAAFDAEGTPSQSTQLVTKGILQTYLYDKMSADIDKTTSTGNSVRVNFKDAPRSGTRNLYVQPGASAPESLYEGVSEGVAIQDLIGIHTANPITGDFSVGASGHFIRNGQREEAIHGFAVSGNLHEMLRQSEAVGADLKFYGSIGAPSLRIRTIDIGGT